MLRAPTHIVELGKTTKTRTTATAKTTITTTTTEEKNRRNSITTKKTTTKTEEEETPDSTLTAISFMQRWHIGKSAPTTTTTTTKRKSPKALQTSTIENFDKRNDEQQKKTTVKPIVEQFYNETTSLCDQQRKFQQQAATGAADATAPSAAATTTTTAPTQKSLPIFMREHLTTKILLWTTPFSFKKTKKHQNLTTATEISAGELKIPKVTIQQQQQQQQSFCNNFENVTYPKHKKLIEQLEEQIEVRPDQQQQQQNLHQTQQPKPRTASIVDIEIENISELAINEKRSLTPIPTYRAGNKQNNNQNNNNNNNNNNLSCFNNKNNIKEDPHRKCNYLIKNNKNNLVADTVSDSGSGSGSGPSSASANVSSSDSGSGSDFCNFKSPTSSQSTSSASYSTASSLSLPLSTATETSNVAKQSKSTIFHQKSKRKPSTAPPTTTTTTKTIATATASTSATSINVVPTRMSPTSQTPTRTSLFDSCHRKIRLISGGPVAFLGGLVAKARRKERDGDQNSTDTKLYLEESVLERKLPEADLKALVDLPAGLDYNEWLASHTLALFEHVNLVYGTISEFCTPPGCPDMTGPGNRTYLWFDEKGKKTRVAAPQYIDYVMTFTQKTVSDESIFPTKYANEFPSSFESIARKILRLQFHVIAHLYAAHFREIALLGLHTHLNLTFAHLTALHRRFNLIDEKETDVLRDLEVALRLTDDSSGNVSCSGQSNSSNSNSNTQTSSETASMVTASSTANSMASSEAQGGGASKITNSPSNNATAAAAAATSMATSTAAASVNHCNTAGGSHQKAMNSSGATRDDMSAQHGAAAAAATIPSIDGDARVRPICTQPEAASKPAVFGGGDGLIGGILGDLSSGEFVDTSRYCTSAIPMSSVSNSNFTDDGGGVGVGGVIGIGGIGGFGGAGVGGLNSNNGVAATLHLNFNNNHHHNHNLHYHHHHHVHHLFQQQQHHHHHHQHQHQHQHQHPFPHPHQQNTGLIQCNASNAPSVNTAAVSVATAAATAAANSTASTSAA